MVMFLKKKKIQKSKKRVTVAMTCSMTGEIRPLLIIGNYEKPRCLRGIKIPPLPYFANKKAGMSSFIYSKYLMEWDRELTRWNRNILLFVDNCPAHPKLSFSNIQVSFFPKNNNQRNTTIRSRNH